LNKIIFQQMQAPGDLLMLTVALRDLHKTHPFVYETDVITCYPEVFFLNPYITYIPKNDPKVPHYNLDYGPYLKEFRRSGMHFSDCFITMIENILKIKIHKSSPFPHVELHPAEKSEKHFLCKYGIKKPYWLINAGIKSDIPLKQYPPSLYQKVVNIINEKTNGRITLIQTGHSHHLHPRLDGVHNFIGRTNDLREYFALVYHADGLIGPISMQMHLAAAFDKPCVVIAGGREEPSWEKYNGHSYLSSVGQLDCCETEGCWKTQIGECYKINDEQRFPPCMTMITPEMIAGEVLIYQELMDLCPN
jgi:ADP-heptose:LPS heptosyltransferase